MFDYKKLRGRIVEKGLTENAFAKKIGLSSTILSLKLNNKVDFTQTQIMNALAVLDLNKKDVAEYFFN